MSKDNTDTEVKQTVELSFRHLKAAIIKMPPNLTVNSLEMSEKKISTKI